jgi:hypothetical protein
MDARRLSRAAREATRNAFVEFVPGLIDGLRAPKSPTTR